MNVGSIITGQAILNNVEDEGILNNALETLSNISTEEGLDATLVAEKYLSGCLEILETSNSSEVRDYKSCEDETELFISGEGEYVRHKKMLNFIVKLIDHPSVQKHELLFSLFSAFLREKRHSNYLNLAYILCNLAHGAITQFHTFVVGTQMMNGNSILAPIIIKNATNTINDNDKVFSNIIIYIEKYNHPKLASSIKTLFDKYLIYVSSVRDANYSNQHKSNSIDFQSKHLLEYLVTILHICPDLIMTNMFTMSLTDVNLDKIIEFEASTSGSEIRLSKNGKIMYVKFSVVFMNILNSLATASLLSSKGYTNFFIIMEHVCRLSATTSSANVSLASKICQSFQHAFFDKVMFALFRQNYICSSNLPVTDINDGVHETPPTPSNHDQLALDTFINTTLSIYIPSYPKLTNPYIKDLELMYDNLSDVLNSFSYIHKLETYSSPNNVIALLFLIGYYKNQPLVAQNILIRLLSVSFPHKHILSQSFSFLSKSFSFYFPDVVKNVLLDVFNVNYNAIPVKKSIVTVENLKYILENFESIFDTMDIQVLSSYILQKLPHIISLAKVYVNHRLHLALLQLSLEAIVLVSKYPLSLPDFCVTVEIAELIIITVINVNDYTTLNLDEDNVISLVTNLTVEACKDVANPTFLFDRLLEISWARSTNVFCPAKKDLLAAIREQSDISKQLQYSLLEEVTGLKKSDYIHTKDSTTNVNAAKENSETSDLFNNVPPFSVTISDNDMEEPLSEYAVSYIINILCKLSRSTPNSVVTCQKLILDRFAAFRQNRSDTRSGGNLNNKHHLSRRISNVWYTFFKRRQIWKLFVAFSVLYGPSFLLKAVPIFIPLVSFITYYWADKNTVPSFKNDEIFLFTTEVFELLQILAPHPLNKLTVILESIQDVEHITVLSQALLTVLETIFYDLNMQNLPRPEDINSWPKTLSNVRNLAMKNLDTIRENLVFFL